METNIELLNKLEDIEFLLYVIGGLSVGVFVMLSIIGYSIYKVLVTKTEGDTFGKLASKRLEQGELEELEKMCRDRLKSRPNSVHAHYYLGRIHFKNGRDIPAKNSFEKALECEPHWENSIRPYLNRIAERREAANKPMQPTAESGG